MSDKSNSDRFADYVRLGEEMRDIYSENAGDFSEAIRDMIRMFQTLEIPYAVIGALAVAAYVDERRSTRDIDVVAPPEWKSKLISHAKEFGFVDFSSPEDSPIQRVVHRNGVPLDIIFDTLGFADLRNTEIIELENIGQLRIAAILDIAYCKLLTQDPKFRRAEEKRLVDRADLVALLRKDKNLPTALLQRIGGAFGPQKRRILDRLLSLHESCAEAGVEVPELESATNTTRGLIVVSMILLLVAAIAGVVFLVGR